MKVLVTGGAGFIGSHVVELFQGKADEIRVLDNLRTGYLRNLKCFEHTFIEGSITDRDDVRAAVEGVDYVFHMAAMISVPESMDKPLECVEINTSGTLILLEEAARAGVKKLVLSSSAAVYGDLPEIPKRETTPLAPKSPYAVTKLDGEYYCDMFAREGRLPTVCLRYFNVFGPRQDPTSAYAAAVPIFIDRAVKGEPITIFGDGEQTRDFVYVKEVAGANAYMAMTPEHTGVFNVARGGRISINDLARKIIELSGSSSTIEYEAERPGDIRHSQAAIDRLQAASFNPEVSLEAGLCDTIQYFAPKS